MTVAAPGVARDELEAQLARADDALCQLAREVFGVSCATVVRARDESGAAPLADGLEEMRRRAGQTRAVEVIEDVEAMAPDLTDAFPSQCTDAGFCAAVALVEGGDEPQAQTAPAALVLVDTQARPFPPDMRQRLRAFGTLAAAQYRVEATARRAREQADLYRLLADHSTDTIVRGTLDGVRLYVSPAVRTLLGYEPAELVGRRAIELVHPDDLPEFRELMRQVREGHLEQGCSEQRQRHKDGSWVWIEAFIRLTYDRRTGQPDGYVVSVRDISRRKAAEARLAYLAAHDALTGLANRSLLQERLDMELARAQRTASGFALLCLDLDRFKQINDTRGHEAGDVVLRTVADRFLQAGGKDDLVARLGGDEFVVVLAAGADPQERAERLSSRLIELTGQPIPCQGTVVEVGLSVGIAVVSPELVAAGCSVGALLREGDRALYLAKEGGRNRYVIAGSPGLADRGADPARLDKGVQLSPP